MRRVKAGKTAGAKEIECRAEARASDKGPSIHHNKREGRVQEQKSVAGQMWRWRDKMVLAELLLYF